jgi:lipopolysaccharide export system permease protein
VYYNLLNLGVSWISSGKASFAPFLLLLHGGTFVATVLWLAKQHNNWAVAPLVRRWRTQGR